MTIWRLEHKRLPDPDPADCDLTRPNPRRCAALGATILFGLAVDQGFAWGQAVVDVAVWLLYLRWVVRTDRAGRITLLACLVFATIGECVLSLVWGLYDYRLGTLPLFVPPGHALLLMLGMQVAGRCPGPVAWGVPIAAAPVVAWQAWAGVDTLGPWLFAPLLLAMAVSQARRLYAVMFVLALLMELYGTWLGNWAWRAHVPGVGWATTNPPLCAGAFYSVLDLLVMAVRRAFGR